MSKKNKMTIEVISKDEGLSMIKEQAALSGPGIVINTAGKFALDLAVSTDTVDIEDVATNKANADIVETDNGYKVTQTQPQEKPAKNMFDKLEKTGVKSKASGKQLSKGKPPIPPTKLK